MDFLEKNLEDIIFETDNELLSKRGLCIGGTKKRQVNIGNYGIADIISFDRFTDCLDGKTVEYFIKIRILELKKDKIDAGTFLQALKYCKGIKSYIEKRKLFTSHQILFEIILIGKKIDLSSSFIYLADFLSGGDNEYCLHEYFELSVYSYSYEFDGIKFDRKHGYSLINEGFNLSNCKSYQRKKNSF
jgi:hypothetical protein